jgi:NAD(P)-dependent dehydrogenase (short-subunit alcohol dehydrogenase family)
MAESNGRLAGKVAIVTGAGQGIGAAIAEAYAREGAKVLITGRTLEKLDAVAGRIRDRGGEAVAMQATAGEREHSAAVVGRIIADWGRIDVLVNNAWGGGRISRVEQKTDELLHGAFAVGYFGPFWAMQAAFPHMRAQRWGRIVNLCSLNGVNAHMGTVEYNAAKEALRSATRTAAREWAGTGIVCNVICPAAKSASFRQVMAEHPELVAAADASNPMGYIGDPYDDIAPVALFLASEDCRYVTGNTLFVDGGSHINGSSWAPELPDGP